MNVVAPDGERGTIPSSELDGAIADGFKVETEQETEAAAYKDVFADKPQLAMAASGIDTMLLGLPSQAVKHLDDSGVGIKALRALEDENKTAHTVGAVAGTLAPIGGASLAAGLGRGAAKAAGVYGAKSFGKKLAAKALEGGIEGAVFGAGHLVSEEALGRAEFSGESVAQHVGLGAIIGAGTGGLFAGIGEGLKGGARLAAKGLKGAASKADDVGGGTIRESLEEFAGDRALKAAVGHQKRAFTQLERKGLTEKAKKYLLEEVGVGAIDDTAAMAERLAGKRDEVGKRLGDLVTKLDEVTTDAPLERISPRQVAARAEKEVLDGLQGLAAGKTAAKAIKREIKEIKKLGVGGMTFAEARRQRAALQDTINYNVDGKPLAEAKKKLARIWNDVIDDASEPLVTKYDLLNGQSYKDVRGEFRLAQELTDFAENRVAGDKANRFVSPSDYGTGIGGAVLDVASGGGAIAASATGAVTSAAHNLVRTRGNAFLANMAYKASKLDVLQSVNTKAMSRFDKVADAIALTKAPSVKAPSGAATDLIFNTRLAPDESNKQKPKNREQAVKTRIAEIDKIMSDPEGLTDRVAATTSAVHDVAPQAAAAMAMTAARGVRFLHEKAPRGTRRTATLTPLAKPRELSPRDVAKFDRYFRAVMDPISTIEDVAKGRLTPEGAEVLREVYPELRQEAMGKIAARLAERAEPLPIRDRVQLSILFGVPVDDVMQPGFIRRMQSLQGPSQDDGIGQGQGGGGVRLTSIDELDLGSKRKSEGERLSEL